jgi:CO/xanthine dehydrogenase FAD-binding subunit
MSRNLDFPVKEGIHMNIKQYVKAESLAEAYALNQKRSAVILGGACWLRLSPRRIIGTAIDLSGLGLDQIEDTDDEIRLGAMVTLRQMELSAALADLTGGVLQELLRHIVGVQFRNLATIGGSISGRFGFSDILTLLLVLDAQVELYQAGRMKLSEFAATGAGRDND